MQPVDPDGRPAQEEASLFQVLVLLLSLFVLASLVAQTFFRLPPEEDALLLKLDTLICLVFLGDFFLRLYRAEDKGRFMRWGWIDLLSSIPMFEALRWGRVVRVIRMVRVLRAFRSTKVLLHWLYRNRDRAAVLTAAMGTFLVALFSSVAILTFEAVPGANIVTASDGLWWSFYTLANIDYMGHFPVSAEGKAVRFLLVVMGMVLFGVFTGYAASYFLEDDEKRQTDEMGALRREIELLRRRLEGA